MTGIGKTNSGHFYSVELRENNRFLHPAEIGNTACVFVFAHCGAVGTLNRNGKKRTDLEKQLCHSRLVMCLPLNPLCKHLGIAIGVV